LSLRGTERVVGRRAGGFASSAQFSDLLKSVQFGSQ